LLFNAFRSKSLNKAYKKSNIAAVATLIKAIPTGEKDFKEISINTNALPNIITNNEKYNHFTKL
jgi:hypothetical protein